MTFQSRVQEWMQLCFGPVISADTLERNDRFFEEATELVQSLGYERQRAHSLVDYVFDRPAGEPAQEVGGTMVTLAALCEPNGLVMDAAGETELRRILAPEIVEKIRAKQAAKPKGLALPMAVPGMTDLMVAPEAIDALTTSVKLGYTNWRGEYGVREIMPMRLWFGATDWHPQPQWLLKAWDVEKDAERDFALVDLGGLGFVTVDHTGCIYRTPSEESAISIARANSGNVARLLGADGPASRAALDVLSERKRQIDVEGWSAEHDDDHSEGAIAQAAAAYAYAASAPGRDHGRLWPWDPKWWKPGPVRRMLVKGAALLIAEIERLDRKALQEASRER